MLKYIAIRTLTMIPVMWIIVTISFFMMRIAPGGPFDRDRVVPEEVKSNIERKYHLNEPLYKQYLRYMNDLAHFDLGPSFKYKDRTVNDILRAHTPISFQLGVLALGFALVVGIPAGCIAALRQNSTPDYAAMSFSMIGVSVPNFVLAAILVYVFALMPEHWAAILLNLSKTSGNEVSRFFCVALYRPLQFLISHKILPLNVAGWGDNWRSMILPPITLGFYYAAFIARLSRAGLLEIIRQDYVRTARAKGLRERTVLIRHALKGGLLPVVSFMGPATAAVLTGSLVVEKIFGIPGIGSEFVDSALNRDYTLVLGTVILYSVILVVLNLVVDILYAFIDPRIEYK